MGREWDRKRKIDELLKSNISADMKKDLEAERAWGNKNPIETKAS